MFCLINSRPSSNSTQVIEALLPSKKWHTEGACSFVMMKGHQSLFRH